MVDTIESFVAKLQSEGVEAGQADAEKIRAEAQSKAEQILKNAQSQAEKITAEAKKQAQDALSKSQSEIKLAARDVALRLRETIAKSLELILAKPVEQHLNSAEFLSPLLHDIIMQYARADCQHVTDIEISVSPELQKQLADWAINELHKASQGSSSEIGLKGELAEATADGFVPAAPNRTYIDLKGNLAQAGFEYALSGGTVEVTVESVVETLTTLLGPSMRELFASIQNENDG